MYIVSQVKDVIKIVPRDFGKDRTQAILDEIDRKYANKVLPDVGLCLCVFDLLDASEGKILYGDGCVYHKVEFTLAVFRPYIGESLVGRVLSSSAAGIRVSVDFFDDILIPPRLMQYPSAFDASLGEFYWASSFADHPSDALPDITDPQICPPPELDDSARLYIQKDAPIRIRIEEETFSPVGPKEPPKVVAPPVGLGGEVKVAPEENVPEGPPPYALIATCDGPGLGVTGWWDQGGDEDAMEE